MDLNVTSLQGESDNHRRTRVAWSAVAPSPKKKNTHEKDLGFNCSFTDLPTTHTANPLTVFTKTKWAKAQRIHRYGNIPTYGPILASAAHEQSTT